MDDREPSYFGWQPQKAGKGKAALSLVRADLLKGMTTFKYRRGHLPAQALVHPRKAEQYQAAQDLIPIVTADWVPDGVLYFVSPGMSPHRLDLGVVNAA